MFEKIVLVTRKTRLEGLLERFGTRGQAKFYLEHSGGDFAEYEREDAAYRRSLETIRRGIELGLKIQVLERFLVPTYLFTEGDIVVTAGQDGVVANTAKYVGGQPIVAANPDPERFDGILLPFKPEEVRGAVTRLLEGKARTSEVTLAAVSLNDGQRLLAFNDFYLGSRTHVSSRYQIAYRKAVEPHSSSGVIVSTGAGSTGWLSSVFNMAAGVASFTGGRPGTALRLAWKDPRMAFVVREPFASRHSRIGIVAGLLEPGEELRIESRMPSGGVVFSDGIESDALDFNSGAVAKIAAASQRARLVVR